MAFIPDGMLLEWHSIVTMQSCLVRENMKKHFKDRMNLHPALRCPGCFYFVVVSQLEICPKKHKPAALNPLDLCLCSGRLNLVNVGVSQLAQPRRNKTHDRCVWLFWSSYRMTETEDDVDQVSPSVPSVTDLNRVGQ